MTDKKNQDLPFWEANALEKLNHEEWEALCDGCARCCLFKLRNEETHEVFYTNVVCQLLNTDTCQCTDYLNRSTLVPTCLTLNPALVKSLDWLPATCAYRRLQEGKQLPWWHPLLSRNKDSVHFAGISVRGKNISELDINMETELEDYIIEWIE